MRAKECFVRVNKENIAQARNFYEQALKIEGANAILYTMIGFTHFRDFTGRLTDSRLESFAKAEQLFKKAITLNDSIDLPHIRMGWIHLGKKDIGKALFQQNRQLI